MNPKNIAGTVAAVMITAEQAKGWVDVASAVVSSPASTLIFMLLVLMMVGWLARLPPLLPQRSLRRTHQPNDGRHAHPPHHARQR